MEIPKCTNRNHAQQGWHTAAKRMKADTESIASNQKDNFDAMRGEQNNTTSLQNYNGGGSGRHRRHHLIFKAQKVSYTHL